MTRKFSLYTPVFYLLAACGPADVKTQDSNTSMMQSENCVNLKGAVMCDFDAYDEKGITTSISTLRGNPIVLDLSAMWCGPCALAASTTQQKSEVLPKVTFLTVLIENMQGLPPKEDDLSAWKETYGIDTQPVWSSSREILTSSPIDSGEKVFLDGWPTFYFINSKGEIEDYMKGYESSTVLEKASALE